MAVGMTAPVGGLEEAAIYWTLPFGWSFAFFDALMGPPSFVATELDAGDAEAAAALHARAFGESWSGEEFESLLRQASVFGFLALRPGAPRADPAGIVLARLAADEAEILTIAVDRAARGRGLGRLLMDRVLQHLHRERARALFLEVDETNEAALRLYRRLRFREVGQRPAYYAGADGRRTSALVLKRELREA